jgi:hypothetical protein
MNLSPTSFPAPIKKLGSGVLISGSQPKWLGVWALSSEITVNSRDLRDHLNWLFTAIIPSKKELLAIQELQSTKMAVSCFWWSKYGEGGPAIWPEQMAMFHRLNLELNISFSYVGHDEGA